MCYTFQSVGFRDRLRRGSLSPSRFHLLVLLIHGLYLTREYLGLFHFRTEFHKY